VHRSFIRSNRKGKGQNPERLHQRERSEDRGDDPGHRRKGLESQEGGPNPDKFVKFFLKNKSIQKNGFDKNPKLKKN
jgi:hypothetical protein